MNLRSQSHHRHARILAPHHACRAGVVLLTGEQNPVIPYADNCLDHANAQPAGVERVALLDMGFEIADIMPWVGLFAGPSVKAGTLQRLA